MTDKLRLVFMGTPDFAATALRAILDAGHDVVCVYSQPPRPKGRGQNVQKSAVQLLAEERNIEVRYPLNFKQAEDVTEFEKLNADLAIVAAYGLILPESILNAPKHGCINIHASLLPRWRGAAPIQRSIMAGDSKTGITIMQMEKGLDTGPEILKRDIDITADTSATTLHDALADLGGSMIVEVLETLNQEGALKSTPQSEEGVTYASMLEKSEGRLDFTKDAEVIDRQVRALNPWPGTWCENKDGKRIKIKSVLLERQIQSGQVGELLENNVVVCGDNFGLKLLEIQPESKKPMDMQAAINGGYLKVGDILS
ncbi:MAG: methionyl-tRNA formyltransferase [Pseudomonadota bacterium]